MQRINILLQKIEERQQSTEMHPSEGIFPSFRKFAFTNYRRADNNLFFTSLILLILNRCIHTITNKEAKKIIRRIKANAYKNFHLYKNKAGGVTYNFWQEHPKNAFPNSKIIFNHKHFHIPDDLDDSALAYIAKPHTLAEVYGLKRRAEVHINSYRKTVENTFDFLKDIETYTTWSGDTMYYEFDLCVTCNLLSCFGHYNLPKDKYDLNAVRLIELILEKNYHLTYPYESSHHYANKSMILYHLARLCVFDAEFKKKWAKKISSDIEEVFHKEEYLLGKIILANALMKLGSKAPQIDFDNLPLAFPFFIIGLMTPYENKLARNLAKNNLTWLEYNCEAYSIALKLVYLILKNQTL